MTNLYSRLRWVGVAAAVATGFGTLMPWLISTDENIGVTVSPPGIDAGMGGLTVLVFAISCAIALGVHTRFAAWVAVAAGAITLLLAVAALFPSPELLAYLGLPGVPRVGPGVWVCIAGSLVVIGVALYGTNALRDT